MMALQEVISDDAKLLAYNERRIRVAREVDRRGYGTRALISQDLKVSPATISAVLNGRIIDPRKLDEIEGWLNGLPLS